MAGKTRQSTIKPTPQLDPAALGISLDSPAESPLFGWLLACLLLGKPIQPSIAAHAYRTLTGAGITSLAKLRATDWDTLVDLLDQAHYVRFDFSTATKLLHIASELHRQYGTVSRLVRQSADVHDLHDRLLAFKGIGPVTAALFTTAVRPAWFKPSPPHEFAAAELAAQYLHDHGYAAYLIGGAVRDLWLGYEPKDFDLVTDATPAQIIAIPEFQAATYTDPAQAYGVTRVKFTHHGRASNLEIATFRKDLEAHLGRKATKVVYADLEDDVLRRDFTINALALDPSTSQVIDYVDGIADLEARTVRFIGDPRQRIREDPLRIMRAIRFKNQLGFRYHPATARAITQAVRDGFVESIAVDRLRDELTALLLLPDRRQAVTELDRFGILELVLPEVTAGKGVPQQPGFHAEGDVWRHQLLILDYLPPHPSRRLVWAALLHDIGKGPTVHVPRRPDEQISFHRHYAVGAELAKTVLRRLKFSNHETRDITWMIYHHLAIDDLPTMRPSRQQRMLGNPAFEDLLELHRADAAASWRPGTAHGRKPAFKAIERIWHTYQSQPPACQQPSLKRDLGIDGHWLQQTFGAEYELSGGPLIGRVLAALDDWYRDEGVTDPAAITRRARQLLRRFAVR